MGVIVLVVGVEVVLMVIYFDPATALADNGMRVSINL